MNQKKLTFESQPPFIIQSVCIFGLFSVEIYSVQFKEHATKVQHSHSWSKVTLIDYMHLIQIQKFTSKFQRFHSYWIRIDFWLFWWFRIAGDGARAFGFSSSINFQHKTLNKCYSTGICCVQRRYDFMTLLLCSRIILRTWNWLGWHMHLNCLCTWIIWGAKLYFVFFRVAIKLGNKLQSCSKLGERICCVKRHHLHKNPKRKTSLKSW